MQIILRVITDLDLSKRSRLAAKVFQLNVYDLLHYLNIPTHSQNRLLIALSCLNAILET